MGSGCVLRTSITFQRRVWECATARYINLWPKFKQKRGKYGNSMVNPVDSHPMEYFTLGGKSFRVLRVVLFVNKGITVL